MKIAIDISPIQYIGTGVGRYIENLCLNLLKIDQINSYTFFYNSFSNRLSNLAIYSDFKQFSNLKISQFYFPEKVLHKFWNDWQLFDIQNIVNKQDIFYYSDWFTPPFSGRKITTVHDLIFKKYPETVDPYVLNTQKKRFSFLHKQSFDLIADSYATKNDLLAENFPETSIEVVYPGISVHFQNKEICQNVCDKYHLNNSFILSVGKIEPRKNYQRLISAFKKLNYQNIDLVIVGKKGWGSLKNIDNQRSIKILDNVNDQELFALYQRAMFFIMPSLYEGFGFPALEAMALSCPTVLSKTSSLLEIGKEASVFFNPLSEQEMTDVIKRLIYDFDLRENLKAKGLLNVKKYSWEEAAKSVLKIISKR